MNEMTYKGIDIDIGIQVFRYRLIRGGTAHNLGSLNKIYYHRTYDLRWDLPTAFPSSI